MGAEKTTTTSEGVEWAQGNSKGGVEEQPRIRMGGEERV
jgi:hypothetical protein